MNGLTLTFLGTGTSQGIPVIGSTHPVCLSTDPRDKRLRVSILLEWENHAIVVDCGPDFRQQMLTHSVDKLDALLITHEHADHVAGLDDLRPFYFKHGDIQVYTSERVHEDLKKRFAYIFAEDKYPGVATLEVTEIQSDPFTISDLHIQPVELLHGQLSILGFVFKFKSKKIAYCTDVKTIPEQSMQYLENLDVLIINALRESEHHSHLNIPEATSYVQKLKPKQTYFTHISHHLGFHAEADKKLPKGINLAYDNLKISL